MRISTSMQFNLANGTVARRSSELLRAQQQIATGRKVNSFGEDPVASSKILREESALREVKAHRRTALEAELMLQQTDATLADVNDALQRAYELAVQMGNDTYSQANRSSAADEVIQISERLVELGNIERNGRFLFAGLGNTSNPFQADGTFIGDTEKLSVPVGRGANVDATLDGGGPFIAQNGDQSFFEILGALETALRADNGTAIRTSIDEVRSLVDRTADAQQTVGHRFERLANVSSALDRAEITASTTLKTEKDTDFTQAVLQLQESEAGMRSALLITARINELNLTNFLG